MSMKLRVLCDRAPLFSPFCSRFAIAEPADVSSIAVSYQQYFNANVVATMSLVRVIFADYSASHLQDQ
jgi:hypothetical protein